MSDGRCKLGLRARLEIARAVDSGASQRSVARRFAVSPATVNTLWHRWRQASPDERAGGACLLPRRPVPKSCPWKLSAAEERAILDARRRTNYGPLRLTWITGRHRSTTYRVLRRNGCSRRQPVTAPRSTRRFEWAQPGALLHIDAFTLPKFPAPGHWATGERSKAGRPERTGKTVVIGVQDDHSRLVYCELHSAENAVNVSACLERAAVWMADQGCGPVEAVISDNAKCYAHSHAFKAALSELGARHILCPPYTPRWNGKLERFWHTLDSEWARCRVWPNSTTRDRALSSFIRFYNRQRPHTAAGGRPPITRVQQVREQDI
jgi:transposase InsO family protein